MILFVLAGTAVLAVLVADLFQTVFVPRGDAGIVTRRMHWAVWAAARSLAGSGPRRRRVLALVGPLLLPLTVLLWAVELVLGFALVYFPMADRFVVPESGSTPDAAVLALYVSGYSATTLGVGDISAGDELVRLLSVVEAAMGFAVFSAGISYALSMFSALSLSTALAHEISTCLDEREVEVVAHASTGGPAAEQEIVQWLVSLSGRLSQVAQLQKQYALLAYFHVPDDARALPVAMARLLELLTSCRSLVDPAAAPLLTAGPTVGFVARLATQYVVDRSDSVREGPPPAGEVERERAVSCARAVAHLSAAGVPLRPDRRAGSRYTELRAEWDEASAALLAHFGYGERAQASDA